MPSYECEGFGNCWEMLRSDWSKWVTCPKWLRFQCKWVKWPQKTIPLLSFLRSDWLGPIWAICTTLVTILGIVWEKIAPITFRTFVLIGRRTLLCLQWQERCHLLIKNLDRFFLPSCQYFHGYIINFKSLFRITIFYIIYYNVFFLEICNGVVNNCTI